MTQLWEATEESASCTAEVAENDLARGAVGREGDTAEGGMGAQ
jgi:hypothetical protein